MWILMRHPRSKRNMFPERRWNSTPLLQSLRHFYNGFFASLAFVRNSWTSSAAAHPQGLALPLIIIGGVDFPTWQYQLWVRHIPKGPYFIVNSWTCSMAFVGLVSRASRRKSPSNPAVEDNCCHPISSSDAKPMSSNTGPQCSLYHPPALISDVPGEKELSSLSANRVPGGSLSGCQLSRASILRSFSLDTLGRGGSIHNFDALNCRSLLP